MDMIIVWALSWWYGAGLAAQIAALRERLLSSYDYFSIGLLAKTLFAPFRQISASNVRGPIGVQLRAFVDKLISRIIGSIVRTMLIITGILWMIVVVLVGLLMLLLWLIFPFAPLLGFIAMISGWVPQWK